MWDTVLATIRSEFSDLPDAEQWTRLALRLGLAVLLGAMIGYEREQRERSAGTRTHMLVALGAALFVYVPQQAGMTNDELSRIIQGLVAGIGFLGTATVLKPDNHGKVRGITTAAGIWTTAAIGLAVGLGREATAIATTALTLIILGVLQRFGRRDDNDEDRPGDRDA